MGDSDANILNVCSDTAEIKRLSTLLPLEKSCGTDLVAVESLRFAHPSICLYLSMLFNLCITNQLRRRCLAGLPVSYFRLVTLILPASTKLFSRT